MAGIFRRAMEIMAPNHFNPWGTKRYEYQCVAFCNISSKKGIKEFERILNNPEYKVLFHHEVKNKGRTAIVMYYIDTTKEVLDYHLEFGLTPNAAQERMYTTGDKKEHRDDYVADIKREKAELEKHREMARVMKAVASKKARKKVRAQDEAPKVDGGDKKAV